MVTTTALSLHRRRPRPMSGYGVLQVFRGRVSAAARQTPPHVNLVFATSTCGRGGIQFLELLQETQNRNTILWSPMLTSEGQIELIRQASPWRSKV